VIAWDGPDGSRKRKTMDKNYKEGRKPIRLNRAFHNLSEDEETTNKVWQQSRLIEYLNEMPIIQTMLPQIEADDVISYITQMPYYKGWQKVVVSNDKDFFQLCDDETILYRPIQKTFVNKPRILEESGIHPTNYALARAIDGDKSDNLKGVYGVGLGKIAKKMSFFGDPTFVTFDDLFDFCKNDPTGLKMFQSILENEDLIKENYSIMQLYSPAMSIQTKTKIEYALETFEPDFNKTEIIKRMQEDGFGDKWNPSDIFATCKRISSNT